MQAYIKPTIQTAVYSQYMRKTVSVSQASFYIKFTLQKSVSIVGSRLVLNFRKELKSVFDGKAFHAFIIRYVK